MAEDLFSRETVYGGSMSSEMVRLNFTAGDTPFSGFIVQNVDIQYSQQLSRLYALESGKVYFVVGQTNGQMSIQHAIGPEGMQREFIKTYGDPCNITDKVFVLSVTSGCTGETDISANGAVKLSNPLISGVQLGVQSGNAIITSAITTMFTSMDLS
jgi:hypothetical protein